MLVDPNAGAAPAQERGQCGLTDLQRIAAQVVAVELDQVEGVQEHGFVVAALAQPVEARHPVVVAGHRLYATRGILAQLIRRLDAHR